GCQADGDGDGEQQQSQPSPEQQLPPDACRGFGGSSVGHGAGPGALTDSGVESALRPVAVTASGPAGIRRRGASSMPILPSSPPRSREWSLGPPGGRPGPAVPCGRLAGEPAPAVVLPARPGRPHPAARALRPARAYGTVP